MNWKDISLMPQNIPLETIDSGGNVQKLIRKGNMFWFPDMSMYVYYVPKGWRYVAS